MVKVGFSTSRKVDFICLDESPLKMIKNGFYFILRALFVHKYLDFCPDFFCHVGKRFDKRATVNFKIYYVTNGEITIHTSPNISRSKNSQTIKFGQLIEYELGNIFSKIMQKMIQGG